jgi:signal transduction histidine kinase
MKRIFVRYVSHEIRTPLNVSILGLKCLEDELRGESTTTASTTMDLGLPPTTSLSPSAVVPFQKKGYVSESISDVLDDVKISCAMAVEILNDLLLYEKIDDGIFSIATTHMPVKALVEEAEKMFRMQARAANVEFVLDLQDKLLDTAFVDVDKGKLHQVLRNLVTNAIKFTSANGEVRLTCRVLQEEENVPLESSTGVATAEGCIAQPHFVPLLQRHERGRVSRSDSFSSMGSSDFSQAYSQSSRGNLIHFATLEHDALPYGSANATSSLAGAASITAQSVGTSSSSSRSGPQPLSSSPYVMNQWPSVLHRQYDVSEIIDPVSAKYSSHQRRKRPRWDDDTKAVSAPPHVASEDDDAAPVVEEVLPPVVRKFVRIAVQDTGPGISAEDQSQLFHEFIQVKADKLQNGQGSGLGLWIAANIMKMHGGRIGVMSEGEGKGSTFLIDIPLVEEEDTSERLDERAAVDDEMLPNKRPRLAVSHDPEDDHTPSSLSLRGGQRSSALASPELLDVNPLMVPHGSRATMVHDSSAGNKEAMACTQPRRLLKDINVLIVDDVPSNRKVVRRLLRDKFGSIDEAENGQVAVNKVHDAIEQGKPFDLILMDFMMPVMNGLDATRLIQARCHGNTPHDVLVIGVTGNGLEADIAAFKEAGADEVMLKPLDYPTFLEHLYKYGYDVTLATRP